MERRLRACIGVLSPSSTTLEYFGIFVVAKLSFNFNYNLVESWDDYIINFPSHPPARRSTGWPLLQLLTLTTTSTITSNLTELGTAQLQLVFTFHAGGWVGVEIEVNASWAPNWVGVAAVTELGNILHIKQNSHTRYTTQYTKTRNTI